MSDNGCVIGTEHDVLKTNWVFAGSILWEDPESGEKLYQAESGDLICVSNFRTATLDIPFESSQVNNGLMFATFTDRIPALRTPVRLVLQVIPPKAKSNAGDEPQSPTTPSPSTAPVTTPPATPATNLPGIDPLPTQSLPTELPSAKP